LSDDAITTLVERVSVIANRPPPSVPTLKIAMAQLVKIDDAVKALRVALEDARKKPLVMARRLGLATLLGYATGRLAMEDLLARFSARLGLEVGAVMLPDATAAVDVDSLADLALVEAILRS
jgi:hypothetical protein